MRWITAAVLVLAAVAIIGLPLYVFPAVDEPRETDVVYVIGPPTDARMTVAESMLDAGLANALMVSVDPDEDWKRAEAACAEPRPYPVYCSKPDPFTTRGEAQWLRAMTAEHGWDSATVVTFTPHITRTRVLMKRCFDGDLALVEGETSLAWWYWAYHYAYQSAAFAKVALNQSC